MPKKAAQPVPAPQNVPETQNAQSSGPRKFVNAKKAGTGESFAPLDPNVVEKALPIVPEKPVVETQAEKPAEKPVEKTEKTEKTEKPERPERPAYVAPAGTFQRRTAEEPKEVPVPADTKFKFGGEGPKKFAGGSKISFKRDEEKSEQEVTRQI